MVCVGSSCTAQELDEFVIPPDASDTPTKSEVWDETVRNATVALGEILATMESENPTKEEVWQASVEDALDSMKNDISETLKVEGIVCTEEVSGEEPASSARMIPAVWWSTVSVTGILVGLDL